MDSTSGLVYNWNRWYAPEIGRYVEVDPVLPSDIDNERRRAGLSVDPFFLQHYGYAGNNPLQWVDPDGLKKATSHWPNHRIAWECDCPDSATSVEVHYFGGKGFYANSDRQVGMPPLFAYAVCFCNGKVIDIRECTMRQERQL